MPRYSAKQKKMRGKARSGRKYLQLYANVKRSRAYHGLSTYARALLFELIDRHTGINNGMIGLGVREAAYELDCSQSTVSKAMRELDDSGLARPLTPGVWRGKRATEWRLMWLRCEKTGDLPVSNWEQRIPHSEFATQHTKVRVVEHKESLSSRGGAQTPNSSMNESAPSSRGSAHIDIYQGEGAQEECRDAGSVTDSQRTPEGPLEEKTTVVIFDDRIDTLNKTTSRLKAERRKARRAS
jgi:hypothetical protein